VQPPNTSYETARQCLLEALALPPDEAIAYTNKVIECAQPADEILLPAYRAFRKAVHKIVTNCRTQVYNLGIIFDDWDLTNPRLAQKSQLDMFPDNVPRREDFDL